MEEEEKILGSILGRWFLWNIQRELTNRSGAGENLFVTLTCGVH